MGGMDVLKGVESNHEEGGPGAWVARGRRAPCHGKEERHRVPQPPAGLCVKQDHGLAIGLVISTPPLFPVGPVLKTLGSRQQRGQRDKLNLNFQRQGERGLNLEASK